MKEAIKNALLLGLGTYEYTKEQLSNFVKSLEKEGVTPEEGKKMVDEVMEKAKKQKDEQVKEIREAVKKVMDELGVVTKSDLDELKKDLKK